MEPPIFKIDWKWEEFGPFESHIVSQGQPDCCGRCVQEWLSLEETLFYNILYRYKHTNMRTCKLQYNCSSIQTYKHANMQPCKHANIKTCERQNMQTVKIQTCKHTNIHTLHYTTLPYLARHNITLHYIHYIVSSVLIISDGYFFQRTITNQTNHKEPLNCQTIFIPSDDKQRHGREEDGLGVPEMWMRQGPPQTIPQWSTNTGSWRRNEERANIQNSAWNFHAWKSWSCVFLFFSDGNDWGVNPNFRAPTSTWYSGSGSLNKMSFKLEKSEKYGVSKWRSCVSWSFSHHNPKGFFSQVTCSQLHRWEVHHSNEAASKSSSNALDIVCLDVVYVGAQSAKNTFPKTTTYVYVNITYMSYVCVPAFLWFHPPSMVFPPRCGWGVVHTISWIRGPGRGGPQDSLQRTKTAKKKTSVEKASLPGKSSSQLEPYQSSHTSEEVWI